MTKFTYSEFFTLGPTDHFTCKILIRESERATQSVLNQVLGEAAGKVFFAFSDEVDLAMTARALGFFLMYQCGSALADAGIGSPIEADIVMIALTLILVM